MRFGMFRDFLHLVMYEQATSMQYMIVVLLYVLCLLICVASFVGQHWNSEACAFNVYGLRNILTA